MKNIPVLSPKLKAMTASDSVSDAVANTLSSTRGSLLTGFPMLPASVPLSHWRNGLNIYQTLSIVPECFHTHVVMLLLTCVILTYVTLELTCTFSTNLQSTHISCPHSVTIDIHHSYTLITTIFVHSPKCSSFLKTIL